MKGRFCLKAYCDIVLPWAIMVDKVICNVFRELVVFRARLIVIGEWPPYIDGCALYVITC